ncbi:OadG family transporter subunit [Geoglobus acetivorans]|uniref:OadG family protein n=1 Tax=Geoglobus acetivorans TaxID=565033 RepID=A0ABZ3H6X0_GEOAI|nr:OadG family protein [Geoglobus acetivorans]
MDPAYVVAYGILTVFFTLAILTFAIWFLSLLFGRERGSKKEHPSGKTDVNLIAAAVSAVKAFEDEGITVPVIEREGTRWKMSYRW